METVGVYTLVKKRNSQADVAIKRLDRAASLVGAVIPLFLKNGQTASYKDTVEVVQKLQEIKANIAKNGQFTDEPKLPVEGV